MHILFTRFPLESADGGAEKQTASLWKGLIECGHEVSFLGSCPVLLEKSESLVELGMTSRVLSIGPPPVTKWGAISFLWRKKEMQRKILENVEELIAHGLPLIALCMLSLSEKLLLTPWAVKQGIKVIWIEHDTIGRWLSKNPWLPELRRLSRDVTTVTVSELSRQLYIDLGWREEDVVGVANGVPPPQPSPEGGGGTPSHREGVRGREEGWGGGNTLHIGCMSRLTPDKGVDVLVHAVADVPDVQCTIVGRGNGEAYIRKLIDEAQQREHIQGDSRIVLCTDRIELQEFYSSIDVLVLPSRQNDPFGLVAAEAMMVGIPVIITDQCGIASHLEADTHALVVPADDAVALREAIIKLQNPALRTELATRGQQHAQQEFTVERMVDRYEKLLTT